MNKTEKLINELKSKFLEREIKYLERCLNGETDDKEELKELRNIKSRLTYIEKLNNELTGKTGKDKVRGQEELWEKVKNLKSTVGDIVRSIPKNSSN